MKISKLFGEKRCDTLEARGVPSGGTRLLSQGVGQTGGPSVGPLDGKFDKGGARRHLYELIITSRCKDINVKTVSQQPNKTVIKPL